MNKNFTILLSGFTAFLIAMIAGCSSENLEGNTSLTLLTVDEKILETVSADGEISPKLIVEKSFAEYAADKYPNVEETNLFTKEEIQQMLYTASTYLNAVMEDSYFASGLWAVDEYNATYLRNNIFGYLSENQQQVLISSIDTINDSSATVDERFEAEQLIITNIGVINLDDGINESLSHKLPDCCLTDVHSCYKEAPFYTDFVYFDNSAGGISVQTNITLVSELIGNVSGEEKLLERTYDYTMVVIPNLDMETDTDFPFVIDSTDNVFEQSLTDVQKQNV